MSLNNSTVPSRLEYSLGQLAEVFINHLNEVTKPVTNEFEKVVYLYPEFEYEDAYENSAYLIEIPKSIDNKKKFMDLKRAISSSMNAEETVAYIYEVQYV